VTAWFMRFELCDPIPDDEMEAVRDHLLRTLDQAGYRAKSTTADYALVEISRKPPARFSSVEGQSSVLPMLGRKGRVVA
jgi:hypothetical protein